MTRLYILLFSLLAVHMSAFSQGNYPFLQPGTTQGVRHFIFPNDPPQNWSFTHKDDSTWCGYMYSRICYVQPGFNNSCEVANYTRGIREENGKAYIRGTSCGGETVQYDFNLSLGDTFDMGSGYGDAVVDSIGNMQMFNGQTRKYMRLNSIDEPSIHFQWVEGIGDIERGFFRSANGNGGYSELICHRDSSGLVYVNPNITADCDSLLLISSIEDLRLLDKFKIYPNPSARDVVLETRLSGVFDFQLADMTGRILKQGILYGKTSLDVKHYSNGIYFFRFTQNKKVFNRKLVISH